MSELAEALGLTLPNVSHHLRELRRAGLIRTERQGRFVNVALDERALRQLADTIAAFARHGPPAEEAHHER